MMSNIAWNNIRATVKSIFDDKDQVQHRNPGVFGAELDGDHKIKFWYRDIFRFEVIGVLTEFDDYYQINLRSANPEEIILPLGDYDELEFVLMNGRPSRPYNVFNNVMNMFLEH